MLFFWIALIIEAVVLVVSVIVYSKEKKWFALFLLFADLAAISYTYFSEYENFSWTKTIYRFAQVEYSANGYNEGKYYGGWEDEYPQGFGRLTYKHFVDEQFYSIGDSEGSYRAQYYEGEFEHGWRVGQGIVVYDGGYKDVGVFYGKWEPGKTVFKGTRWKDDELYVNLEIIAQDAIHANNHYETDHWLTKQ